MNRPAALAIAAVGIYAVYQAYMGENANTSAGDALIADAGSIWSYIMNQPSSRMALSAQGLEQIKQREGFSSVVYPDSKRLMTIGYGHLIKPHESFPNGVAEYQAAALLASDVATAEKAVKSGVTVPLSQNQYDALVSFAYNIGSGAFRKSTLLKILNQGNYSGVGAQFDRWHIPVEVTSRRNSEKGQFYS